VVGLGVIGAAAGVAGMIAGGVKMNQLHGEIQKQSAELGSQQQRVAAVQALHANVSGLILLSNKAQTEVGTILTSWDVLKGQMQALTDDLGKGNKNFDSSRFVDLRMDVTKAAEDWKALSETAKKFAKINIQIEEGVVRIGEKKAA
jgi:hydroxylamine reductase (hybrid-cluster protein)